MSPEKPAPGTLVLHVGPEIHSRAIAAAEGAGMSLDQWVIGVLAERLRS